VEPQPESSQAPIHVFLRNRPVQRRQQRSASLGGAGFSLRSQLVRNLNPSTTLRRSSDLHSAPQTKLQSRPVGAVKRKSQKETRPESKHPSPPARAHETQP